MPPLTTYHPPPGGKTYTLCGSTGTSLAYFQAVADLTDDILQEGRDPHHLLNVLQAGSRRKRYLRSPDGHGILPSIVTQAREILSPYTEPVRTHLRSLSWWQRRDRVLSTSLEQYHLFMIEIELANRVHAEAFRKSQKKLAFLPYCLHDFSSDCKAVRQNIDFVCRGCSSRCAVNAVSSLVRRYGVEPYIWMSAELRKLFRTLTSNGGTVGVVGVACLPELVRGMRLCMRHGVPVVGIPIDANRCRRWMGTYHDTSVNIAVLEGLLDGKR